MKKYSILLFLCLIILLALFLRLYKLSSVPPSPDWDEAALGYNAYSLLHTGKDEYGKFLPVVLRSFDDYKPALYAYLAIPSISMFGLTVFAVRFPAALIGGGAVLGTYLFVTQLLEDKKAALISSFLLAISPWHIQFTHIAFEAGVGMACNLFAAVCFLKGLKKPWFLLLSVFFFSAGVYVYQSEKVFAPLLFLLFTLLYWKQLLIKPKIWLIGSLVLGIILIAPLLLYTLTNKNALARAQGVSFLADQTTFLKQNVSRLALDRAHHDRVGLLVDNRRILIAKTVAANYLSHFDLNWLFITGDIARHHAPGMGLLYICELPFLLTGIYTLLWGSYEKKTKQLLFLWFLFVPIPASITTGVPHAVRTLNFLPLFQIFTALGIVSCIHYMRVPTHSLWKKRWIGGVVCIAVIVSVINIMYYLDQYYVQQNYYTSEDWQYGYAKVVPFVSGIEHRYKKIVVSNKPYMDQSYIFFLFYQHYPAQLYQKQGQYASGGFRENHTFGKYEFRPINWEKEIKSPDILYIGQPEYFPPGKQPLLQVNFLDNTPAMEVVEG